MRAFGEGLCGIGVASVRVERAISFMDALARALENSGLLLVATGQAMSVSADGDEARLYT